MSQLAFLTILIFGFTPSSSFAIDFSEDEFESYPNLIFQKGTILQPYYLVIFFALILSGCSSSSLDLKTDP